MNLVFAVSLADNVFDGCMHDVIFQVSVPNVAIFMGKRGGKRSSSGMGGTFSGSGHDSRRRRRKSVDHGSHIVSILERVGFWAYKPLRAGAR